MNTETETHHTDYNHDYKDLEQMNQDLIMLTNILWFACGIAGGIILTVLAIYIYHYCKLLKKKNKVSNLDDKPLLNKKKEKSDTAGKKEKNASKYIQKIEIEHQDSITCEEEV